MPIYAGFQVQVWPDDDVRASVSKVGDACWLYMRECSSMEFSKTLFAGATFEEVDAIAKAINAAISGAKARALEAAIAAAEEPVAQAAE